MRDADFKSCKIAKTGYIKYSKDLAKSNETTENAPNDMFEAELVQQNIERIKMIDKYRKLQVRKIESASI